jgi:photosystem II stability/assembly factor-like uncharacterized protein
MMKTILTAVVLILFICPASTQSIQHLAEYGKISFRGLSVVSDSVLWVSGSSGTTGRSIDGGKTWKWSVVKGFEKRDLRDIEAFDANTAIVIAVAEPANILKTIDGGTTWKTVFSDTTKGMFLDALDFSDGNGEGIVVGDPIDGKLFLATTNDAGENWTPWPSTSRLNAFPGEAMFAASGSNLKLARNSGSGKTDLFLVTGGMKSRLYHNTEPMDLALLQGKESTGANGLDIWNGNKGIIVGGDFAADSIAHGNCVLFTVNGRISMTIPNSGPHGYRSGVAWLDAKRAICCGTTGVDISTDGGANWKLISTESYHVCKRARNGKSVFLAGSRGKISRLDW